MANQNQIDLSMTQVLKEIPNRFLLSVAVSKRARQLKEGYKPLVEITEENPNPILTALKEIEQGKLSVVVKENHNADEEFIEKMEQDLELHVAEQETERDDKKSTKEPKEPKKSKSQKPTT